MVTPLVDVARHQPGTGRDACIERPTRLVGVAIEASVPHYPLDLGRSIEREPLGWVRADVLGRDPEQTLDRHDLQETESDHRGDGAALQDLRQGWEHGG